MNPLFSGWLVTAIWTFGPLVLCSLGWIIKLGYSLIEGFRNGQKKQDEAIQAFTQGQAAQNQVLAKIENELEWWRNFREENRKEMESAWGKLDRHEELLHDHGTRITRIEATGRPDKSPH